MYQYWQLNKRKFALQQAYMEKWNSIKSPVTGKPVDILLMPAMPHTAVPHRGCSWVGYTKIWNVLDYSALVIPGGKIEAADATAAWDYSPRNELDEWNASVWTDNKQDMVQMGLPLTVQLVGRRLEEEKVLGIGAVIDSLIKQ